MFGLAESEHEVNEWIGSNTISYSINRNTGMKVFKGSGQTYATVSNTNVIGEIVSVILDTRYGALSFQIGGKNFGEAYSNDELRNR